MNRIGLVLGAGGSFGWDWIVGALAAVRDETGFDPRDAHDLVGTSVGSLVGAYLRHGSDLDALSRHVGGLPDPDPEAGAVPIGAPSRSLPAVIGPVVVGARRVAGTAVGVLAHRPSAPDPGVGEELAKRIRNRAWPDAPLSVVAWSRSRRRRVVLQRRSELPLPRAVDASCAVPGATPPVPTSAHGDLIDGGVHSMTNADLLAHDVDLAIVVAPLVLGGGRAGLAPRRLVRLAHRWTLADELATQLGELEVPTLILAPSAQGIDRLLESDRRTRVAIARAETTTVLRAESAAAIVDRLRGVEA
ncbi:MAG: hypothetical protein AAGA99_09420 [Actinomycetota bacterium]